MSFFQPKKKIMFISHVVSFYNIRSIGGMTMDNLKRNYGIADRIEEIYKCLDSKLWQSALALSLTIPDICGQIEFKEMKTKDGRRLVGKQYKAWFEKYVLDYFCVHNESINPKYYFTEEMCWELRNSFLHSGMDDISKVEYRFTLRINSCDSYSIKDDNAITHVDVDIEKLCMSICEGARCFCEQWEDKHELLDKSCSWEDVKEYTKMLQSFYDENK